MAYYNYKIVRDKIPNNFEERFIQEYEKVNGFNSYEGDANYDGDRWLLAAEYIDYLDAQVAKGDVITVEEWFKEGAVHA